MQCITSHTTSRTVADNVGVVLAPLHNQQEGSEAAQLAKTGSKCEHSSRIGKATARFSVIVTMPFQVYSHCEWLLPL
jgi:hypothetical protein